ncbi:MAG: acylphosphatase [Chloroflexi bacterium]|nr:acylphosphatase [Chloroflexota bacterium]
MAETVWTRAHVRVSGRVQGVGFRYATRTEANRAHAAGWVRNLPAGEVEAVFEGPREAVEALVRWCHQGPPGSWVRSVRVDWTEPVEHLAGFSVRASDWTLGD